MQSKTLRTLRQRIVKRRVWLGIKEDRILRKRPRFFWRNLSSISFIQLITERNIVNTGGHCNRSSSEGEILDIDKDP